MLGLVLRSRWLERLSHGIPVARLLLVGEVALLAAQHLARLDRIQRRRLLALMVATHGRPARLRAGERAELMLLLARLEPRLFLGLAVRRLSPMPLPKRVLYGPRRGPTRAALERRN